MVRRSVDVSIKLGVVGFILLEDVVDDRQQHPCNGNDSFFVTPALFQVFVASADFRIALLTDRAQRALNEQRFDVSPGSAHSGGFLLSGTFVVLRRKTGPRAKMLGGREHGHIHSDFRDDTDSGIGLDTRHRHNKVKLRKILLGKGKD